MLKKLANNPKSVDLCSPMEVNKSHIISQLQKDILSLQGLHAPKPGKEINFGLNAINPSLIQDLGLLPLAVE